jgi:hypothetical protein
MKAAGGARQFARRFSDANHTPPIEAASSTITLRPARVRQYAVVSPAIPAPITQTSAWVGSSRGVHCGKAVPSKQIECCPIAGPSPTPPANACLTD